MKIQPLMALVALSLPPVPGARAAVRGFTARTLGLLTLACLLVAAPATAQVNYAAGGIAFVKSSPNASSDIVIASTYLGNPVVYIADSAFAGCTNLRSVTIPNNVTYGPTIQSFTAAAIFDSVDISSDLCVHAPPAQISCRCRGMREPYENPTELVGRAVPSAPHGPILSPEPLTHSPSSDA